MFNVCWNWNDTCPLEDMGSITFMIVETIRKFACIGMGAKIVQEIH